MRCDTGAIQPEQHRLGQHATDRDVHDVRRPQDPFTEHNDVIDRGCRRDELIDEAPGSGGLALQTSRLAERGRGRTEADDADDVLETAAPRTFLGTADNQRLHAQAATDHECSHAGRSSELVSADRDEVGP